MQAVAALFVIGVSRETRTPEDVTRTIEWHLERGRIPSSVVLKALYRGMPVFARAVGTGELCLMGRCRSPGAERIPHPKDPSRWPVSYEIDFERVLRGVRAADVLGPAANARQVRGLDRTAAEKARQAFEGASRVEGSPAGR